MRIAFAIALRYLLARKREKFLSVITIFSLLGLAIGVGTLIVVMGVMEGFHQELLSRILGFNGHVVVRGSGIAEDTAFRKLLEAHEEVELVMPTIRSEGFIMADGVSRGVFLKAARGEDLKKVSLLSLEAAEIDRFDKGGILIGRLLALQLQVEVGDKVSLILGEGYHTAFGFVPKILVLSIAGIFDVGMYEYDAQFALLPLETGKILSGSGFVALEVFVNTPSQVKEMVSFIKESLPPHYEAFTWQEVNASFFQTLEIERRVMKLILFLMIFVAAFNVISSLVMLVQDKRSEIAILRGLGAGKGEIVSIFLICGALIGLAGSLLGGVVGSLICIYSDQVQTFLESLLGFSIWDEEIRFLKELPMIYAPWKALYTCLLGQFVCFLASLYPAWKASCLSPAEGLRHV